MALCVISWSIPLRMIVVAFTLDVIIIIKPEIWLYSHCLRLDRVKWYVLYDLPCYYSSADTRRDNNVIVTSKRRRDVVLMS